MNYTEEDICKAKSFVLDNNHHFDSDTQAFTVYKLHHADGGNIHYYDDVGNQWDVAYDGAIQEEFTCAMADNHIEFNMIENEVETKDIASPSIFSVNEITKVHHTDPLLYDVTVRVDEEGLGFLEDTQNMVGYGNELEVLYKQRDDIEDKIDELKEKIHKY